MAMRASDRAGVQNGRVKLTKLNTVVATVTARSYEIITFKPRRASANADS